MNKPILTVVKVKWDFGIAPSYPTSVLWYADPGNPYAEGVVPNAPVSPKSDFRPHCYRKWDVKHKFGDTYELVFKEK